MKPWLLLTLVLSLTGCDGARVFGNAFWDELRGPPDAEDLAASTRFQAAGISFDYPAELHYRHSVEDDGDRSWSLEYGMFELEVRASSSDEVAVADLLGVMAEIFEGGRSVDSEPPTEGRTIRVCDSEITSTRIRMKMMGDWSELEGFDLPAPKGESRMLIFSDEPVKGQPSSVARATWERVLGSLRCDAGA